MNVQGSGNRQGCGMREKCGLTQALGKASRGESDLPCETPRYRERIQGITQSNAQAPNPRIPRRPPSCLLPVFLTIKTILLPRQAFGHPMKWHGLISNIPASATLMGWDLWKVLVNRKQQKVRDVTSEVRLCRDPGFRLPGCVSPSHTHSDRCRLPCCGLP